MGNVAIVASCSGKVFGLEQSTGALRWTFPTGAGFHGEPVVARGMYVVPCDNGSVYALEPATGRLLWQTEVSAPGVLSDLVAAGPYLAGLDTYGVPYAVEPESGKKVWPSALTAAGRERVQTRPPAGDAEGLTFAEEGGIMKRVDASSGATRWRRELGAAVTSAVVADGGSVLVGLMDGRLLRLAAHTGELLGSIVLPDSVQGTPEVLPNAVVLLVASTRLVAVAPDLSKILWTKETTVDWTSPRPLGAGDSLYAGTDDGQFYALAPKDGSMVWQATFEGAIRGLAATFDTVYTVYVGTISGKLYAIREPRNSPSSARKR